GTSSRDPERKLRIGYVSPDFRCHSVAYFIAPILKAHERTEFEVVCYSNALRHDAYTQIIQHQCDAWRSILGMSDETAAELVVRDQIDILVDLAGHTAGHSLGIFAKEPAPIQVTYLGYPNTTCMPMIDYRITDAWADPLGESEHLYSEQLVRPSDSFLC